MDKSKNYLLKLLIESEDEGDFVRFTFPNEERKIKCSINMLSEVSPVFKTMFSETWCPQTSSVKMGDLVQFDQYLTFKLFVGIVYGMYEADSLSVTQATDVYFYSHKYQVEAVSKNILQYLNKRMNPGMSTKPFSVDELKVALDFYKYNGLEVFKKKLDEVILAVDKDNSMSFFKLANEFGMNKLKMQVIGFLKTIEPNENWQPEVLCLAVMDLQSDKKNLEDENGKLQKELEENKIELQRYLLGYRKEDW